MASTDSPDSATREAERPAATTGGRFERPGAVPAAAGGRSSGRATTAIVLGILGILAGVFIPIAGLVLGIIGVVLGVSARGEMRRDGGAATGGATAGVVLSIIAIVVSVANWIATAIIVSS
jgi:hypothetical protein